METTARHATTHAAHLRRRRERRSPDCRSRPSHAGRDIPHGERPDRRRAVLQVREPAARRRLQVPRRLQRPVPPAGRRAAPRRRDLFVRKPRPGDRAGRPAARHPAGHRHAGRRPGRQAPRDRRIRRRRSSSTIATARIAKRSATAWRASAGSPSSLPTITRTSSPALERRRASSSTRSARSICCWCRAAAAACWRDRRSRHTVCRRNAG